MTRPLSSFLALALLLGIATEGLSAPPVQVDLAYDEQTLKRASVPTDGAGLLAYFQQREVTDANVQRGQELIAKLGSGAFKLREKASADLIKLGEAALPALIEASKSGDAEVRRRAEECLKVVDLTNNPTTTAAVRVLRVRNPEKMIPVLLGFLPTVREESVEEEILISLTERGQQAGQPDPALVRALDDRSPARRAAAALTLAHTGDKTLRASIRQQLEKEPHPHVRLRGAQGLLAARDVSAVPILLPLLTEASIEQASVAQDLLASLSGGDLSGPKLGEGLAARKECRTFWEGWWKTNEAKLDLAKADVDLPWRSLNKRAEKVALRFIDSLMKGDNKLLRETTAMPFSFMGIMTVSNREEFDKLFEGALQSNDRPRVTFEPPAVVPVEDFLRKAPTLSDFLKQFPSSELRVIYITGKEMGKPRSETLALLIRIRAGKAHVIGLGEPEKPTPTPAPGPVAQPVKPPPRDKRPATDK